MRFNASYEGVLHSVSELLVWSNGIINISEVENLDLYEFEVYREIFKNKFEAEQDGKKEFIKNTFEFAKKCTEAICKTVAGAYGTKQGKSPVGPGHK